MPATLNSWQLLGVILASALFWMQYVNLKDWRQPEPRRRLLTAFGLGIMAAALAMLAFAGLDALGVPDLKMGETRWAAVYCFLFVGPIEEGAKAGLAYLFILRWREFDEPIDGFVYASAISLGFASLENFRNVPEMEWRHQLAYSLALPITHTLFSAVWGFGAGHAHCRVAAGIRRRLWQAGTLILAMLAHGLHDYLIFAYQATVLTGVLALGLWGGVIWYAHKWVHANQEA